MKQAGLTLDPISLDSALGELLVIACPGLAAGTHASHSPPYNHRCSERHYLPLQAEAQPKSRSFRCCRLGEAPTMLCATAAQLRQLISMHLINPHSPQSQVPRGYTGIPTQVAQLQSRTFLHSCRDHLR